MKRVEAVKALAAKKGLTPGQLALAWLLDRDGDIVPIPGTKRRTYLRENAAAADARLTAEDRKYLDEALPPVSGERYSEQAMKMIDRG
jgi:aryl-alcohol dehydrogenase-like predicted oxidoreductase